MHNVAMFIFVILAILLLVTYWQLILTGLAMWVLANAAGNNSTVADPRPSYPRKPVQTRPVAKPVQTRPKPKPVQTRPEPTHRSKPAREMPAPEYLPRWTANRRLEAGREHAQWQKKFDSAAQ